MSDESTGENARSGVTRRGVLAMASAGAALAAVGAVPGASAAAETTDFAADLGSSIRGYVDAGGVTGPFYLRRGAYPVATPFSVGRASRTVGGFAQTDQVRLDQTAGYFALTPQRAVRLDDDVVLPGRTTVISLYPDAPAVVEYRSPVPRSARVRIDIASLTRSRGPAARIELSIVDLDRGIDKLVRMGSVSSARSWQHIGAVELAEHEVVRLSLGRMSAIRRPVLLSLRFSTN